METNFGRDDLSSAGSACATLLYTTLMRPFVDGCGDVGAIVGQALARAPEHGDALADAFTRLLSRERGR